MIKTVQGLARLAQVAKCAPVMSMDLKATTVAVRNFSEFAFKTPKKYPLPPVKPMNTPEEDAHEIEKPIPLTTEQYLGTMGLKMPTTRSSAYVAIEKNGVVYHLYDASKYPYGRMCGEIAVFLRGKNKPIFKRNEIGCGDVCVVVNASNIKLSGRKLGYKKVRYHTGFIGHLKEIPFQRMIVEKPEQLVHRSISKMLPKNLLRGDTLKNLHVYRDQHHEFDGLLPYFGTLVPSVDFAIEKLMLDPREHVIVAESNANYNPIPELAEFKREYDPSLEIPLVNRKYYFKENPTVVKEAKRADAFAKRMARRAYTDKIKYPKDRSASIDQEEPFFVKSEKQVRRWGLKDHLPTDKDEPEP